MQEEKIRLLLGMSRFQDVDLLNDTLESSLSSRVRSQDTITVVAGVAANPRGRQPAWEFVKNNWAEFDRRYGGGGFGLMRLVSICNSFTTEEQMADVERFFAENPAPRRRAHHPAGAGADATQHPLAGAEPPGPECLVRGVGLIPSPFGRGLG